MRYREIVKIIQNRRGVILAIIFLIILIGVAGCVWLVNGKWPDWTGFGEYIGPVVLPNQTFQPAKTFWDLMQLLIIPAILVGGAYWLNESARKREKEIEEQTRQQEIEIAEKHSETERKIASDNRQETALQIYLDKMTELLLDKKLRESKVDSVILPRVDEVKAVARARTLTVLQQLDGNRKGALLRFLYEADLIDKDKIVIDLKLANLSKINLIMANLSGANLKGTDLRGANLSGAYLYNVDLYRANLSEANLSDAYLGDANLNDANLNKANLSLANLNEANLIKADLSEIYLYKVNLIKANLNGANLSGASLDGVDLRNANLSGANLSGANLIKADLDGAIYTKNNAYLKDTIWPDGFDPVAAGAMCVNE